jgi:23S rRNA (uracil1939-C5)-methyltransferase
MIPPIEIPHAPRRGDHLVLEVRALGPGGVGEAHYEALVGPQREPFRAEVEVPGALPGEVVTATVAGRQRRRVRARATGWEVRATERVAPACPHFGNELSQGPRCGGCTLQHASYAAQLVAKERWVSQALERLVPAGAVRPIVGMETPWGYRNKMEYSFGPDADRSLTVGLHPRGWRFEIMGVSGCLLQSSESAALAGVVAAWARERGLTWYQAERGQGLCQSLVVREGKRTRERMLDLVVNDAALSSEAHQALAEDLGKALSGEPVTTLYWTRTARRKGEPTRLQELLVFGPPVLREELHVGGRRLQLQIPPRAFFQPNTRMAETLLALAREALDPAEGALYDLYAGTGSFGLALADRFPEVVAVELEPAATASAAANAILNGVPHIRFLTGDTAQVLRGLPPAPVAAVVVDPPRSGLDGPALELVAGLGAPRLCYVSCHLEALARDLERLAPLGYRAEWARPVDMFPHTPHVETVVALARDSA